METVIYISETGKPNDEEEYGSFEYEDNIDRRDRLEIYMKDILEDTEDWENIFIRIKSN